MPLDLTGGLPSTRPIAPFIQGGMIPGPCGGTMPLDTVFEIVSVSFMVEVCRLAVSQIFL